MFKKIIIITISFSFIRINVYCQNQDSFYNSEFCKDIEVKVDEYNGNKTISSPFGKGLNSFPFHFSRIFSKEKESALIMLTAEGKTYTLSGDRLDVIFEDKSTFSKQVKILPSYRSNGNYIYYTSFNLSEEELELFKNKKVAKYRIYIFEKELSPRQSNVMNEYFKCVFFGKH